MQRKKETLNGRKIDINNTNESLERRKKNSMNQEKE